MHCIRHKAWLGTESILAEAPNLNICDNIIELCVTLLLVSSDWLAVSGSLCWLVVDLMAPGNKNQA